VSFNTVWTITRKELKIYFSSPLFYVMTALFVLFTGFIFALNVVQSQSLSLATTSFITQYIMVLFAPLITMRLLSEEKQTGTIELMLTGPVRDVELILGKYLAALVMFAVMLSTTLIQVVISLFTLTDKHQFLFLSIGNPDWATIAVGYLGSFLIIAGFLAIGMFTSSVTQSQIIAAVVGIVVLTVLTVIDFAGSIAQPPISDLLTQLGPRTHDANFTKGTLGLFDVVYTLSLIGVPLYLSVVALGARKWH
jgi:ABC-2 type transport system permease protein